MKSLAYIEEDFVAGLLNDFFPGNNDSTYIVTSPSVERELVAQGFSVLHARDSIGPVAEKISKNQIDLVLAQSEDVERLIDILEAIRRRGRKVPTLILTSHPGEIPEKYRSFAHCISTKTLLESNLRWHIQLAKTMRRVEEVREHFKDAESVLILLQDDPDPDGIASGLALRQVLGRNKQTAPLGSFGRVTRPENIAMIRLLEIEIEKLTSSSLAAFDRIAMVDLQPPHLSNPVEWLDLVIDHHPEQFNYTCVLKDIRPSYGATATILVEYLQSQSSNIGTRLATALLYGIKSDTFFLGREVNHWDIEAFSYLYPLANQNLIRRMERPELPPAALDALSRALRTRRIIDRVAFVHLGRVERDDLIPQMADFCLQFEGVEWAVVSGIYHSNFIVSVRNVGYVRGAGRVLKDAFGDIGSAGGHASMAKAIIPLSELSRKWNIDVRSTRSLNRRIQREFLKNLRGEEK